MDRGSVMGACASELKEKLSPSEKAFVSAAVNLNQPKPDNPEG